MNKDKDSTDDDTGRPGPWGEGRHVTPGQSAGDSVRTPPGTVPNADERPSAPVTRDDYELPGTPPSKRRPESSGGDAG